MVIPAVKRRITVHLALHASVNAFFTFERTESVRAHIHHAPQNTGNGAQKSRHRDINLNQSPLRGVGEKADRGTHRSGPFTAPATRGSTEPAKQIT